MEELREATHIGKSSLQVDQSRKTEVMAIPSASVEVKTGTGQLLTTGEAYEVLRAKGFDKSINTFRRALSDSLKSGVLPESLLSRYGLLANFEIRLAANPKDNSVRWLHFD